jgi:hypothetical protein
MLGLERVQALLFWDLLPSTSFTSQDRRALGEDVETVRARSLGDKCK